ncbi:MAG: PD40 domain-containing protein [Candidatus Sungbacteria bacterium]|nr:PD40 domain-containing protein [Candidatus Sungbacteria bacterium]
MELNRTKQIIYGMIALIILSALGFSAYWYLSSSINTPAKSGDSSGSGVISDLPGDGGAKPGDELITEDKKPEQPPTEQKLLQLTNFSVVGPSLNATEDKILFYKKEGGDLLSSDFNGQKQDKISNITILGVLDAFWNPARNRAIVQFLDNDILKSFVHSGTSSVSTLPADIIGFSWSPDGKSIAYTLLKNNGAAALVVADSSGKNPKEVFSSPLLDASIRWIASNLIALQTAPSGRAEGYVFTYSRSSGSFNKILGPRNGLQAVWAPDGSKMLTSQTNRVGKNLTLGIYDSAGKELFQTGLPAMADKCVWLDAKNAYCAVPRSIPENVMLPDDYLMGEFNSSDRIIQINLDAKESRVIFDEGGFDVSNIISSKDGSFLFFIDRNNGTLWRIKL